MAAKIDGVKVPRDKMHGEGWDYDGNMANVVIYGQACEQLKGVGATSNVQIIFGCPGIIIESRSRLRRFAGRGSEGAPRSR